MHRFFLRILNLNWLKIILIFPILSLFLISCNNPFQKQESYTVQVLEFDKNQNPYFTQKTLKTLKNPKTMDSDLIKVRHNTKLATQYIEDMVPSANFRVSKNGVLLPTDSLSFLFFGLYAHMETLLDFDIKLGLHEVLSYPRVISVQTQIQNNKFHSSALNKNNLVYIPGLDRILIYKFDDSNLPAALNMGLIAHEHFHAIFDALVKPLAKSFTKMSTASKTPSSGNNWVVSSNSKIDSNDNQHGFNFLYMMALSEGLSDFWAWLITQDENPTDLTFKGVPALDYLDFSSRSLNKEIKIHNITNAQLRMDLNYERFKFESDNSATHPQTVRANFYNIGIQYARYLKTISEQIFVNQKSSKMEDQKVFIGKWIIESLKELSKTISELSDKNEILTHEIVLSSFINTLEKNFKNNEFCISANKFSYQIQSSLIQEDCGK